MSTCSLSFKYRYICDPDMWEEALYLGIRDVSVHFLGTNYIFMITPVCWVTNYMTNNLYPGSIKLFSGFKITLARPLKYCNFIDHFGKQYSCFAIIKNNLAYLKLKLIKPNQVLGSRSKRANMFTSAPTTTVFYYPGRYAREKMTEMYIHQKMDHESHKKIQQILYHRNFQVMPKSIRQITVPRPICMLDKSTRIIFQTNIKIEDIPISTHIHDNFTSLNITPKVGFTSASNIVDS